MNQVNSTSEGGSLGRLVVGARSGARDREVVSLSARDLDRAADIYVESFSGAPWFEQWDRSRALVSIAGFREAGGQVVGLFDRLDGGRLLRGLAIGLPLIRYAGRAQLAANGFVRESEFETTFWIAEVCTATDSRNRGVATELLAELRALAVLQGASQLMTRTRIDNVGVFGAFERTGLHRIGSYEAETGGVSSKRVVFAGALRLGVGPYRR